MNPVKAILKGELIGQYVRATYKTGKEAASGTIVDETKNTFTIATGNEEKKIAKDICSFEFKSKDALIAVAGENLSYRPHERIKRG